jgi:hypothetical protein
MAKVHERILEFNITLNAASDNLAVTSLKYYRDRAELAASNGLALSIDTTSAQTSPAEIQLGELMPPPTHVRFVFANF